MNDHTNNNKVRDLALGRSTRHPATFSNAMARAVAEVDGYVVVVHVGVVVVHVGVVVVHVGGGTRCGVPMNRRLGSRWVWYPVDLVGSCWILLDLFGACVQGRVGINTYTCFDVTDFQERVSKRLCRVSHQ
jgi:hypothetical protein